MEADVVVVAVMGRLTVALGAVIFDGQRDGGAPSGL